MKKPKKTDQKAEIMVVDDQSDNLHIISDMLSRNGYNVRSTTDGSLVLHSVQIAAPDLILLDVKMPGLNGYEICQQLKADPKARDIPIIFISALDTLEDKVKAFTIGGVDYVTKPFQEAEILARINTHLSLETVKRELRFTNDQLAQWNEKLENLVQERTYALQKRLAVEQVLGRISEFFIKSMDYHKAVNSTLGELARLLSADRIRLFLLDEDQQSATNTHEWHGPGIEAQLEFQEKVATNSYPIWKNLLSSGSTVRISNADQTNDFSDTEQKLLEQLKVKSLLIVPIPTEEGHLGFLAISSVKKTISWNQEDVHWVETTARLIGSATRRHQVAELVEKRFSARTRELNLLTSIASGAGEEQSLNTILLKALQKTISITGVTAGSFHLLSTQSNLPDKIICHDLPPRVNKEIQSLNLKEKPFNDLIKQQKMAIHTATAPYSPLEKINWIQAFKTSIFVPINVKGNPIGLICLFNNNLKTLSLEQTTLLTAIADLVGIVIISTQLRKQTEENAILVERQRLARELHDSVSQTLSSMMLYIKGWQLGLKNADKEQFQIWLEQLGEITHQVLKEMRLLLYELGPAALEHDGLDEALHRRLEAVENRAHIKTDLYSNQKINVPPHLERELYLIIHESLNNILKHARATEIKINLEQDESHIKIEISDNGIGFDVEAALASAGMGLKNIRERAKKSNCELKINSQPGHNTLISIRAPLNNIHEQ